MGNPRTCQINTPQAKNKGCLVWKNVGGRIEARQGGQDIVRGKERGQIVGGGGGGGGHEQSRRPQGR